MTSEKSKMIQIFNKIEDLLKEIKEYDNTLYTPEELKTLEKSVYPLQDGNTVYYLTIHYQKDRIVLEIEGNHYYSSLKD
jgi:hypothetical protein